MVNTADDYLGYQIKVVQHALHLRMEDVLRPFDLTSAQYAVLVSLKNKPDQTNADLAARAFITPQSMQGVLSRLERASLVERRSDPDHGRRQLTRLTKSGRNMVLRAAKVVAPVENDLRNAVSPVPVEEAFALLKRLNNSMQSQSA